jgi:hypothetical protein
VYLPSAFRPGLAYGNAKGWGQNIVLSLFKRKFAHGKQAIKVVAKSPLLIAMFPDEILSR